MRARHSDVGIELRDFLHIISMRTILRAQAPHRRGDLDAALADIGGGEIELSAEVQKRSVLVIVEVQ